METDLKPDIVWWDDSTRKLWTVELIMTVPFDKLASYMEAAKECKEIT